MRYNPSHPKKPTATCRREENIKKSVFIAIVGPADTAEAAMTFIRQHSDTGATHNCWAYKIGQSYRFNDDGEPGGTAGKPILAAIEGQGFDHCVALVIRYYGGIKLGTGGLMRAYGGVVARALQEAPFEPIIPQTEVRLHVPFAHAQTLHNLAARHQAAPSREDYDNNGVHLVFRLPDKNRQQFIDEAINLTRGQARVLATIDDKPKP